MEYSIIHSFRLIRHSMEVSIAAIRFVLGQAEFIIE